MERYRLGPVRDARGRDVDAARGALADTASASRSAAAAVEAIRGRIAALTEKLAAAVAGPVRSVTERARLDAWAAKVRRELAAIAGELARAEAVRDGRVDEVEAAKRALGRARAAREVIERHFEAWRAERRRIAERRED